MKVLDTHVIKNDVLSRLEGLDLDKVILFGSLAQGHVGVNSDIDLYVVTKDEGIPATWTEKNQLYLMISRRLRDLRRKYPIDLIVHTRAMHARFVAIQSSMAREIMGKGVLLYG